MIAVVNEQNTDCAFTAMAGDGGAGDSLVNFGKSKMLFYLGANFCDNLGVGGSMSDENALKVGIGIHFEDVVHVFIRDIYGSAAEFFTHDDFAFFK